MRVFCTFLLLSGLAAACGAGTKARGPQEPSAPPLEEEVTIEAASGPLSATLLVPAAKGPFPAVLILAGSGPTDRDGNNPFIKTPVNSLKDMARYLADRGFAVLRYDKRGVGKSPAGEAVTDAQVMVSDCRDAFLYLAGRPEVDGTRVALLGHSEGGLVVTLAAKEVDAAALIIVSSAGRPILEVMKEQINGLLAASVPEEKMEEAGAYFDEFLRQVDEEGDVELPPPPDYFSDDLKLVFTEVVKPHKMAVVRTLYVIDPAEEIPRFPGPVLILHGDGDSQVPLDEAARMVESLEEAGHADFELAIIPGMDHVLKQLKGQEPEPYDTPGRKTSEKMLETLAQWLAPRLKPGE